MPRAQSIPHLTFDRVQDKPLADIWYHGSAFNAYRGTEWMSEPCSTCERKTIDFGGCRCQAMAVIGDASATDPVCIKSPHHKALQQKANEHAASADAPFVYRTAPGDATEPAE